ncbi:MAG: hypothetical protein K0R02_656 [Rickettsiaceae bacterium]|jgi:hypothetical protein|nr:hypothetical protein [Rickettsiaceae bacterium]
MRNEVKLQYKNISDQDLLIFLCTEIIPTMKESQELIKDINNTLSDLRAQPTQQFSLNSFVYRSYLRPLSKTEKIYLREKEIFNTNIDHFKTALKKDVKAVEDLFPIIKAIIHNNDFGSEINQEFKDLFNTAYTAEKDFKNKPWNIYFLEHLQVCKYPLTEINKGNVLSAIPAEIVSHIGNFLEPSDFGHIYKGNTNRISDGLIQQTEDHLKLSLPNEVITNIVTFPEPNDPDMDL